MRGIIVLVFMGVLLWGCSVNDKAKTPGNRDADNQAIAKTALGKNSELENNKQKLLKAGMEYLNQGKIPEAIKTLNQAVLLDPRDAATSFVLAQTYLHLKRYESALGVLENIIKMAPDNGEAYYFKSVASGLSGNREQALESAKQSIAIFQEKRDEKNFKRAIVLLQGLSAFPKDAVSSNVFADSQMNDSAGKN